MSRTVSAHLGHSLDFVRQRSTCRAQQRMSVALLDLLAIVDGTVPLSLGAFMSLIKGLVKTAVAAKLIQVAQRELSKPENQQKIREGLRRFQEAARSRR
jgi:hypothetical protein